MSTGPKKHLFLKSVGAFVVFCVAFELVLRLFGYGHFTIYRPDERLLWVPEPGRTLTVVNHLPITINDQGLRYPVDLQPKQQDQFRIITFGDSATQGWGVDDNSHFSAILEKELNHGSCTHEHFQVASGGVNAYSNSLVAEKLKQVVEDDAMRPDVAIVTYAENTNLEKLTLLKGADREKFLRRVELKSIARRSAIYNFVIEDLLRKVAYYQLRRAIMEGTIEGMENPDMDLFNQNLQQSLALCKAHHVQLMFLLLASEGQTPSTKIHPYEQAMIDFAAKEHIPLVNMIPIMSTKDKSVMFMDPDHATVAGHELIAEELKKAVETLPAYESVCDATSTGVLKSSRTAAPVDPAAPLAAR
jgi:lysophospholipase L1-like esterase